MVYAWCIDRVEDREKWEGDLLQPLVGREKVVRPTHVAAEVEGSEFMSFMGTMQTG